MKLITASLDRYYRFMQSKHPNLLCFGNESRREIALTFDDGPHPKDTPQVLETLAKHGVHATFFLLGRHVEQYPDLVKQIRQSGHQLGIHGFRHRPFPLENPATLQTQLDRTRNAIASACGISPEAIQDLRPPYGAFTQNGLTRLTAWGYRLVLWNNLPPHWMQPVSWTIKQVLDQIHPGSIIVLHDGHGHGTKVSQILDIIVPELKTRGYRFVTIEKMREGTATEPQKLSPL
jgi:peptidoglycan/xylan/chitin deacetylase (PgdA/CDA1 family)